MPHVNSTVTQLTGKSIKWFPVASPGLLEILKTSYTQRGYPTHAVRMHLLLLLLTPPSPSLLGTETWGTISSKKKKLGGLSHIKEKNKKKKLGTETDIKEKKTRYGDLGDYLISKGASDTVVNKQGLTCYEGLDRQRQVSFTSIVGLFYFHSEQARADILQGPGPPVPGSFF